MPKLKPLPPPPKDNSDSVRVRMMMEDEALRSKGGSTGTVKTDLDPSQVVGQRRVLLGT